MIPQKPCCERSTYNKISFWPFLIPLSFYFIFPTSPITFYTTQTIFCLQNSILPLSVHHYVWVSLSLNVQLFIFFSLPSSSTLGQSLHAIPGTDSKRNRFGSIKNRREIQHRHLGVLQVWYCRYYRSSHDLEVHQERGRKGYQKGFIPYCFHAERN